MLHWVDIRNTQKTNENTLYKLNYRDIFSNRSQQYQLVKVVDKTVYTYECCPILGFSNKYTKLNKRDLINSKTFKRISPTPEEIEQEERLKVWENIYTSLKD